MYAHQLQEGMQRPDVLRRSLDAGGRAAQAASAALNSAAHFVAGSSHAGAAAALATTASRQPAQPPDMRSSLPAMLAAGDGQPMDSPTQTLRPLRRLTTEMLRRSLEQGATTAGAAASALAAAAHALHGSGAAQLQQEISFGVGHQQLPHHAADGQGSPAGEWQGLAQPQAPSVVMGVPVYLARQQQLASSRPPTAPASPAAAAHSGGWQSPRSHSSSPLPDQQTHALQQEVEQLKAQVGPHVTC
jgi:hypothetical protein